jgi:hypothetical protein
VEQEAGVLLVLRVMTSGLMFAASDDLTLQQNTVEALERLIGSSSMFGAPSLANGAN